MTLTSPRSPTTAAASGSLREALRRYCQHVSDCATGAATAAAVQQQQQASLESPLVATSSSSSAAAAEAAAAYFIAKGAVLATLTYHRTALADILKSLGVDALEAFTDGSGNAAKAQSAAATLLALPSSSSATTSSTSASASSLVTALGLIGSTFSVPSLISQIDALLPIIAFGTAAPTIISSGNGISEAAAPPATFSAEERMEVLRSVVLSPEVHHSLALKLDFALAPAAAAAAAKANSAPGAGQKRPRAEEEEGLHAKNSGVATGGGAGANKFVFTSVLKQKEIATDADADQQRGAKAAVSETLSIVDAATNSTALTRNTTVFVSSAAAATTVGAVSVNTATPNPNHHSAVAAAAVAGASHYDSLLSDYTISVGALAALPSVARRQEVASTCLDVVMRSVVTNTANCQIPLAPLLTPCGCGGGAAEGSAPPSSEAAGAASGSTTTPAAEGASATERKGDRQQQHQQQNATVILTPSFHTAGLPFRYMQVTGQGGGSVAASAFAPLRFL